VTKASVLSVAMLAALMVPATAQTSSPDTTPTPPAASGPLVTTQASPGAPTSPAPEAGSTTGSTTATTTLGEATRILTVDALEDMDLVGADGKGIGDIEGVVENNADKKQFVVIERGGFLGFGAKAITLPLENIAVQGEKVTLRNMDVAQLDGLAEYKDDNNAFRDLDDSQQISVSQQ
jgi:hypothetical protein